MRSLTNVLDEELKLYLLSMLQMQEVARMLRSNVSDKVKHKTGCELTGVIFLTCIVAVL